MNYPSPLVKPDGRVSRIRLTRRHSLMNMHGNELRLEQQPVATSEAGLSSVAGFRQAEPASSCATALRQGSLARPELPGFLATMNPSDSSHSSATVIDSRRQLRPALRAVAAGTGLPGSWLVYHRPPSPLTPENPTAASARCFTVGNRLPLIRKVGRSHLCNEAVLSSRIRITADDGACSSFAPRVAPTRVESASWWTSNCHD